jgi:hypothetical protein
MSFSVVYMNVNQFIYPLPAFNVYSLKLKGMALWNVLAALVVGRCLLDPKVCSCCLSNIVGASLVVEHFHSFFLGFGTVYLFFGSSVAAIHVMFRSTLLAKLAVFFPMSSLQMTILLREEEVELHRHGGVESCCFAA